jgi:hypothetical protein
MALSDEFVRFPPGIVPGTPSCSGIRLIVLELELVLDTNRNRARCLSVIFTPCVRRGIRSTVYYEHE